MIVEQMCGSGSGCDGDRQRLLHLRGPFGRKVVKCGGESADSGVGMCDGARLCFRVSQVPRQATRQTEEMYVVTSKPTGV